MICIMYAIISTMNQVGFDEPTLQCSLVFASATTSRAQAKSHVEASPPRKLCVSLLAATDNASAGEAAPLILRTRAPVTGSLAMKKFK